MNFRIYHSKYDSFPQDSYFQRQTPAGSYPVEGGIKLPLKN